MISFNFGLLSKYLFLILSISFPYKSNSAPVSVNLNQKLCSFKAGDYSLQWAFEPQSKNVVFVLKQKSEFNNFWSGVGFGDRKKGNIDFIGVFVKNGQIGIADTHIIPDNDGNLIPDPSTNVQSIAFDYHNKTVTAKFARALKSPDDKFDQSLDGCQIFNFAINGGSISRSGIVPDFDEIAEKRICDIDKNCVVDIRQHLKPSTSESPENIDTKAIFSDNTKNVKNRNKDDTTIEDDISTSVQTNKNNKKITKPEFAESVDISGTGDPCSFAGNGYNVNWTYNSETEMVEFSMKHPIRMGKWWSAVGIGDTMADMDIAIMFISSGRPKRIRDYLSKSYGVPDEDKQQDWILSRHRTKSVDEMIELGFSRKLETTDTEKDRSLDGCVLFQFAANAGHYGSGFAVRKHEEWPDLYKACDIKKHCTKKESTSKEEKEDGKEEEISESNDDEIIDEADDESDEEKVVTLKKRTEAKEKIENRRQLESSQIENDDGTSTTNVVIQLNGAAFSTLNPSESEEGTTEASAEGTTMSSGEIVEAVAGEGTTLASENVVENQMSSTTSASDDVTSEVQGTTIASSNEVVAESQTTAPVEEAAEQQSQETTIASGENVENQQAASTVSGDEIGEGFKAVNNVATESLNTTAEKGLTPIFDEAAPGTEVSNNEVASTPTTTTSEASATPATETTETTTFPPNVTQQPVHIIPMVGGELNSTMYIPGRDDQRVAPEGGETTNPSGENGQGNGTSTEAGEVTTFVPAFGIYSTVQERPTTISSGESDSSNSDVTNAPELTGEGTEGAENAGTNVSSTSGTLLRNESTDLFKLPPVTPPFNSINSTVSPNLASVESESEGELPTSKGSISIDKNQVETITVPSNVSESVAEAGKASTNFADALNNTAIEVEVTTAESDKTINIDESKNVGSKTDERITTPGEVEIVAETTPEVESALNAGENVMESTTLSSDETIAKGGEATTISDENVTEGGKKGNKGKGRGKNNKNGKGKNADPTIATSGTEIETGDVTVSSDVTTAVPGFNNVEKTTIPDDSDLTQKQTNGLESTISEGAATVPIDNQIALNETDVTSVPSVNVAGDVVTTPSSKTTDMSENQAATTIDSDANGSTVAIGTIPEISTLEGTQTTADGNIATTKSVQLVTGGDSNESGDTTENLLEILSTTIGRVGNGLRDSAVTEPFSTVATNKVTSPVSGIQEATTQATNESPKPEAFTSPEIEGSGETSSSSSFSTASDAAATTPIPGPFDHHKQQLINELGKEAVGNPKEGCGESHEDYSQCTTYFKNYLGRVQIWANENNEKMEDQYGKACTLLSQVQNVTTLCCSIFVETCKGKIEF